MNDKSKVTASIPETDAIRLCIQAQHGKEDYDKARKELNAMLERIENLKFAIEQTLTENAYLADGEKCTLWRLKKAVNWE